jgi:hypothetical protein
MSRLADRGALNDSLFRDTARFLVAEFGIRAIALSDLSAHGFVQVVQHAAGRLAF